MEGMPMEGMPMEGMPMEGMPMEGMPMEGEQEGFMGAMWNGIFYDQDSKLPSIRRKLISLMEG